MPVLESNAFLLNFLSWYLSSFFYNANIIVLIILTCLSQILGHLCQRDRFRSSHVSRTFYQAAHSPRLWQKLILDTRNTAPVDLFHHAEAKSGGRFTAFKLDFSDFKSNWSYLHIFSSSNLTSLTRLCLIGTLNSVYTPGRDVFEDIFLALVLKCPNLTELELDANSELVDQFIGLYLLFTPNLKKLYLSGPQIVFDLVPESPNLTGPPRILNRFKSISFYDSKTHSYEQVNAVQYITSTAAVQLTIGSRTPLHLLEVHFGHLTGDVRARLFGYFKTVPEGATTIDLPNLESISYYRG